MDQEKKSLIQLSTEYGISPSEQPEGLLSIIAIQLMS